MTSGSSSLFSETGTDLDGSERLSSPAGSTAARCSGSCEVKKPSPQTCSRDSEPPKPVCSAVQPVPFEQLRIDLTHDTKQCYGCRRVFPVECFSRVVVHGEEYRMRRCNQCRAKRQEGSELTKRKLAMVVEAKNKPCADCGRTFPSECMDFDHVRGKKELPIGTAARWTSVGRLQAEIDKCDVVCACCHRTRTKLRGNVNKVGGKPRGRPSKFLAKFGGGTAEVSTPAASLDLTLSEAPPSPRT